MAVGGVPTLMDIDFAGQRQKLKAQNQQQFEQEFQMYVRDVAYSVSPNLQWNGTELTFDAGTKPFSKEQLWNVYKDRASKKTPPVTIDVLRFEQEIYPAYSQMANSKFQEQLGTLQMMGLPDKVWNDLYRKNPEYSAALRNSIQNETDPAKVEAMTSYIPEAQPEGITEAFMESPLTFAGGGALAYGAGKGLYGMLKKANFKGAGAIASNLKSAGPALGASFAPGLAKMMGATDYEADVAGLLGTGAATGFYGVSGASSLLRDRLAGGLIGTNDFNALKQRAQALGINQVEGKAIADIQGSKDSAKSLRTEIANKVQGQKLSKSKALLKSANVKPTTGQGTSALKKAGLSKLGGKGAIGMGLLTALQLFNLAKGLYDDRGSSPFSSPSNQAMANPFREVTEVE